MSKNAKLMLAIFFVALVIRLGFVFWLPRENALFPDSPGYLKIADNIVKGKGCILEESDKAGRAPVYPFFLATAKMVFDENIVSTQIRQSLLGAFSALLAFWIASKLFSNAVGIISALIIAVHPYLIYFSGLILYETLSTFLLLLQMMLLAIAIKKDKLWLISLAGLVNGVNGLVHPRNFLSFLFIVPAFLIVSKETRSIKTLKVWAAFLLFNFLPLVPWTIRNYNVCGTFVPVSTYLGGALTDAFGPGATGATDWSKAAPWLEEAKVRGLNEVQTDKFLRAKSLETIREDPLRAVALAFRKLGYFFNISPHAEGFNTGWYAVIGGVATVPIFLFAILGIYFGRREKYLWFIIAPILYYALFHTVFIGSIRYRLPVEPYIIILASFGICQIYNRFVAKRSG